MIGIYRCKMETVLAIAVAGNVVYRYQHFARGRLHRKCLFSIRGGAVTQAADLDIKVVGSDFPAKVVGVVNHLHILDAVERYGDLVVPVILVVQFDALGAGTQAQRLAVNHLLVVEHLQFQIEIVGTGTHHKVYRPLLGHGIEEHLALHGAGAVVGREQRHGGLLRVGLIWEVSAVFQCVLTAGQRRKVNNNGLSKGEFALLAGASLELEGIPAGNRLLHAVVVMGVYGQRLRLYLVYQQQGVHTVFIVEFDVVHKRYARRGEHFASLAGLATGGHRLDVDAVHRRLCFGRCGLGCGKLQVKVAVGVGAGLAFGNHGAL